MLFKSELFKLQSNTQHKQAFLTYNKRSENTNENYELSTYEFTLVFAILLRIRPAHRLIHKLVTGLLMRGRVEAIRTSKGTICFRRSTNTIRFISVTNISACIIITVLVIPHSIVSHVDGNAAFLHKAGKMIIFPN